MASSATVKPDETISKFQKAVERNPTDGVAHSNLGVAYAQQGRWEDAIVEYKKALEINPRDAMAHFNLGCAYEYNAQAIRYGEGFRADEALSEYKEALEINPHYTDTHNNLGRLYFKTGQYSEAVEEFKKALAIDPSYHHSRINLEIAQKILAGELKIEAYNHYEKASFYDEIDKFEEAIAEYKRAIEIDPDYALAFTSLGSVYERKGLFGPAIFHHKRAIEINSNLAVAHLNLGVAFARKGVLDLAIPAYKKAVELSPDLVEAYFNLGMAYYKKGLLQEAIREYEKTVELSPDNAKAHYNLAIAYYYAKDYDLASKHIRVAEEGGLDVSRVMDELTKVLSGHGQAGEPEKRAGSEVVAVWQNGNNSGNGNDNGERGQGEIQSGDMHIRVGEEERSPGNYNTFHEFRAWVAKYVAGAEVKEYTAPGVTIRHWEEKAEEKFPHLLIHCECGNYLPLEGVEAQPMIGSSQALLRELEEIELHRWQMEPKLQKFLDVLKEMAVLSLETITPLEFC